jgi:probable HAF family extracellular repeat protein
MIEGRAVDARKRDRAYGTIGRLRAAAAAVVLAAPLLVVGAAPASASATITDLGTLGGASSNGIAISEANEVIGAADRAPGGGQHPFAWSAGAGMDDLDGHLGYPFKPVSFAGAINVHGAVIGHADLCNQCPWHGYVWRSDGIAETDLGVLPGDQQNEPTALNDAGLVIGQSIGAAVVDTHAYAWTRSGGMVALNLGGQPSTAVALNQNGQVVGKSRTAAGGTDAFSWTAAGGMVAIGGFFPVAVNDSGLVAGAVGPHAGAWSSSGGLVDLGTLPGDDSSTAMFVSANGEIVGTSSANGNPHVFAWTAGGGMVNIGNLGGGFINPVAVNASGQIVGYGSTTGNLATHAFSWAPGGTIQDLGTLGGSDTRAVAVNSSGVVVGQGSLTGDTAVHAFAWTASGGIVDLGTLGGTVSIPADINDNGRVTGSAALAGNTSSHAVVWNLGSGPVSTTTGLATSGSPAVIAAKVTYTATVSPAPNGGTVAFMDGGATITGCATQPVSAATGAATCQTSVATAGSHSITAAYSGAAGFLASASSAISQTFSYAVLLLYNPAVVQKGGTTISLELVDANGANVSASTIPVTITGISPSPAPGVAPSGSFTFRKGTYSFAVRTRKYPSGTYTVSFVAGADPTTHTASFVTP